MCPLQLPDPVGLLNEVECRCGGLSTSTSAATVHAAAADRHRHRGDDSVMNDGRYVLERYS